MLFLVEGWMDGIQTWFKGLLIVQEFTGLGLSAEMRAPKFIPYIQQAIFINIGALVLLICSFSALSFRRSDPALNLPDIFPLRLKQGWRRLRI